MIDKRRKETCKDFIIKGWEQVIKNRKHSSQAIINVFHIQQAQNQTGIRNTYSFDGLFWTPCSTVNDRMDANQCCRDGFWFAQICLHRNNLHSGVYNTNAFKADEFRYF